jgi:formylmethanofuran dehydrogenase subunit C
LNLKHFMDDAYQGKARCRRLDTRRGDMVFGLDDLCDRAGERPLKADIERLVPHDDRLILSLISAKPEKEHRMIWGLLTSISAERSTAPLRLLFGEFTGLELSGGTIILERGGDHVGERMNGGRIFIKGAAGDYLGQEMAGGGIVAGGCGDYAFRNMRGGWGVVLGSAGRFTGVGNSGGGIAVRGDCGERAGWLMRDGRLRIHGNAGDYLGLLMSGGEITVAGRAGSRCGWRMRGGKVSAAGFGPQAGEGCTGGSIEGIERAGE